MECCNKNQNGQPWRKRSFCAVFVNIVLLASGLIFTCIWRSDLGNLDNYKFQSKEYCVVHEEFVNIKNSLNTKQRKVCGTAKEILDILVKKKVEKYAKDEERSLQGIKNYGLLRCKNNSGISKPSRRVIGTQAPYLDIKGILQWQESSGTKDNVTYDGKTGRFQVHHTASFYVYSQVTVLKDQSTNASFCHSIHRARGEDIETLMDSTLPNCEMGTETGRATNFVGGTVRLKAEDQIFVKVSDSPRICGKEESEDCQKGNFFGIHMV